MGALEIVTYQEDALANHYFMVLPAFPGVVDMQQTNFRILNVDIPEKVIDTYEVTHGGKKATRPSGVIGTANEFSFSYRADKYMKVYRGFMAWMEYIQSSQTGTGMGDAVPLVGGPSLFVCLLQFRPPRLIRFLMEIFGNLMVVSPPPMVRLLLMKIVATLLR